MTIALEDLTSGQQATFRSEIGLGDSATRNVGTTAGTVAAGDDSRLTLPASLQAVAAGDRNTLAIVGDSFSARWRVAGSGTVDYRPQGYVMWALAYSGQRMTDLGTLTNVSLAVRAFGTGSGGVTLKIGRAAVRKLVPYPV